MPYAGLNLEGMIALVTGSGRGIGAALAIGLAEAGADVAVSDLPERMEEASGVQARIEDLGRRSAPFPRAIRKQRPESGWRFNRLTR